MLWSRELLGTDIYHIVHWLILYSLFGWFIESVYMSVCNKKVTNRGFATGPFCPIYGVGALTVYFILKPMSDNYILLYFCGTFLATTLEYAVAKIMIRFFGNVWWDYTDKPLNYKGILCLESTIAWGFYTIALFAFLQKFIEKIVESYPFEFGSLLGGIVIFGYSIDFMLNLLKAKFPDTVLNKETIIETIKDIVS